MTTRRTPVKTENDSQRDWFLFRMMTSEQIEVDDETLAYFREHPDEVDEVTAPARIHRYFLVLGLTFGLVMVAASKVIGAAPLEMWIGPGFEEFLVDVIFESGVALIGAALTAYFMGVLLNLQQDRAKLWRKEIRRRLRADRA